MDANANNNLRGQAASCRAWVDRRRAAEDRHISFWRTEKEKGDSNNYLRKVAEDTHIFFWRTRVAQRRRKGMKTTA